jgi:hypothetical protein
VNCIGFYSQMIFSKLNPFHFRAGFPWPYLVRTMLGAKTVGQEAEAILLSNQMISKLSQRNSRKIILGTSAVRSSPKILDWLSVIYTEAHGLEYRNWFRSCPTRSLGNTRFHHPYCPNYAPLKQRSLVLYNVLLLSSRSAVEIHAWFGTKFDVMLCLRYPR